MPARPVFEVDLAAPRRRIARLERYVHRALLTPQKRFICPHYSECRHSIRRDDVFREGVMSHVGRHFDLYRNGKELRVVVVGQESGWPMNASKRWRLKPVSMSERSRIIHDGSGLSRTYYAGAGMDGRNPHMRGTTSALRVIFGLGLGTEHSDEFIHPVGARPFHIFDGFALVNRLLCSASPPNSSQGRSSTTMRSRCAEHFTTTLEILEPTLVVLQGDAVRRWTSSVLAPVRDYSDTLYRAELAGRTTLVAAFMHPAAHGHVRWGDSLAAPYLTEIVVPTLRHAIRRL